MLLEAAVPTMTMLHVAEPLVQAVRVVDLRAYLLSKRWRLAPHKDPRVLCFEGPLANDGMPLVQLMPASANYRDFTRRIEEILEVLSSVEQRPVGEILRDIIGPTSDILHLRLEGPNTRTESLEIRYVERLFAGVRSLLVFAACGEFWPRPFYTRAHKQAARFADRCRLRPGPVGGFGIDVESPIVPPANEAQVKVNACQVERLILLSLMRGLGSLQQAIETGQLGEVLKQSVGRMNANLCDAILSMMPTTTEVRWEARVSWSPVWPIDDEPPQVVIFEGKAFEQIESISRALRIGNGPQRRQLRGRVIRLSGKDPAYGRYGGPLMITLDVKSPNAPGRVEIVLDRDQYRQAGEAHLAEWPVTIRGILDRFGGRWRLICVDSFQVLHEGVG